VREVGPLLVRVELVRDGSGGGGGGVGLDRDCHRPGSARGPGGRSKMGMEEEQVGKGRDPMDEIMTCM
jgi:hypothetical protein